MRCRGHKSFLHHPSCKMCGRCQRCGDWVAAQLSMGRYGLCVPCLATMLEEARVSRRCWRCELRLELAGELLVCSCGLLVPRRERVG